MILANKRINESKVMPMPTQKYLLQHCVIAPRRNTAPGIRKRGNGKVGVSGPYSDINPAANQRDVGTMNRPAKGR